MPLLVSRKPHGLQLQLEGPGGHTSGLACIWNVPADTQLGRAEAWHVFRADFGEDRALSLGEGLVDFREEEFACQDAALLFATRGWPGC